MNKLELPSNIRLKLTTPYDLGLIAADIMQNYSHDPKKQTGAAIIDMEYNIYGLGSNTYPYKKELTEADKNANGVYKTDKIIEELGKLDDELLECR